MIVLKAGVVSVLLMCAVGIARAQDGAGVMGSLAKPQEGRSMRATSTLPPDPGVEMPIRSSMRVVSSTVTGDSNAMSRAANHM